MRSYDCGNDVFGATHRATADVRHDVADAEDTHETSRARDDYAARMIMRGLDRLTCRHEPSLDRS
jgi:hypothetical protein